MLVKLGSTRFHIVYRQVFWVPELLHFEFEPAADALSFRSDVMSSIKIVSQLGQSGAYAVDRVDCLSSIRKLTTPGIQQLPGSLC